MFWRQKQQLVICIVFGIMLSGFFLLLYLPLKSKAGALKLRRRHIQASIDKASMQSRVLPELRVKLEKLLIEVANYEEQIPQKRALGDFLQQIATLMNEHSLMEQMVEPGREIQSDRFNCIPIDVKCKGQLQEIFGFYKSLQSLSRFVRIEDFKLVNDKNLSGEVSMYTKAIVYYKPKVKQG